MTGKRRRKEHAFTLIELLCVIALLSMTALIVLPAVSEPGQKRNLEIAARTLSTDMRKAQQKAVAVGWSQRIEFRYKISANNQYTVTDVKTDQSVAVNFPEGVTYRSVNFPKGEYVKYPHLSFRNTGAPSRGGQVGLENSRGDVLYVIVTPATGRVRISEEQAGD